MFQSLGNGQTDGPCVASDKLLGRGNSEWAESGGGAEVTLVKVVTINSLGMGWEEIAVENAMSDPLLLLGTLRWTTGKIVQALLEDGSR